MSCQSIRIGYKEVPIYSFSKSSSSEDVRFLFLDSKIDEEEGSKAFFSIEVACMKREEVKRVCIYIDPWFFQMERSLICSFLFW
jgi:hypothetical protein